MANLFDLAGTVALITGATGGLGTAICRALAAHGAKVIVSDQDPAGCQRAAANLREQGYEAHALACDLRQSRPLSGFASKAIGIWGRIDTLVCNAGIQGPAGPIGQASTADWEAVMQVNLAAPLALTTHVVAHMAERGSGSVVLMSSIAGLRGNRAIGLYALSKAGLAQLARNLAVEWGPRNIRVNAISPGLIRTPLRRVGEPEEVAGAVVMLASAAGAFITGHNLVIDGGTTISDGS